MTTESSLLNEDEVTALGFGSIGSNVRIDRRAAIFNSSMIHIGSHVRIDAFAVLAGGSALLEIGSYVHVAAHCYLSSGDGGIRLHDFCTLAPRVAIHGHSDDYRDGALTGGAVPSDLTGGIGAPVILEEHVIVGSGSVLLPGVTLGRGCAVGALTVVRRSLAPGAIGSGNPLKIIGERDTSRLAALASTVRERQQTAAQEDCAQRP